MVNVMIPYKMLRSVMVPYGVRCSRACSALGGKHSFCAERFAPLRQEHQQCFRFASKTTPTRLCLCKTRIRTVYNVYHDA